MDGQSGALAGKILFWLVEYSHKFRALSYVTFVTNLIPRLHIKSELRFVLICTYY